MGLAPCLRNFCNRASGFRKRNMTVLFQPMDRARLLQKLAQRQPAHSRSGAKPARVLSRRRSNSHEPEPPRSGHAATSPPWPIRSALFALLRADSDNGGFRTEPRPFEAKRKLQANSPAPDAVCALFRQALPPPGGATAGDAQRVPPAWFRFRVRRITRFAKTACSREKLSNAGK